MNDASAFVVVKAVDPFLVDNLADRFDTIERQPVTMTPPLREEYDALRSDFAHLSARTRILLGDERLKSPDLPELKDVAAESLAVSKIISEELLRFEDATSREEPTLQIVPFEFLDDLLDANWRHLDRLDCELKLLRSFDGYASSLKDAVDELMHSKRMSPEPFQNLAERIIGDVDAAAGALQLLLPGGLSLGKSDDSGSAGDDSLFYAVGIAAARLMAWTAPFCDLTDEDVECLVLASLLQDIGLLRLGRAHRLPILRLAREKPDVYQRHPVVGAALVGCIDDVSAELPLQVGLHHERLDGSGSPRRLGARALLPASRLMGIVSRFVELSRSSAVSNNSFEERVRVGEAPTDGQGLSVASKLYREAEQGMFDMALTRVLLERLGYTFKTRSRPERLVRPVRYLRRDDAHIGTKQMQALEVGRPELRESTSEAKVFLPQALSNRENAVLHSRSQRTPLRSRRVLSDVK